MRKWHIWAITIAGLVLLLSLVGSPMLWDQIIGRVTADVDSISIVEVNQDEVVLSMQTLVKNQNPVRLDVQRAEYCLAFHDDGKWVYVGRGQIGIAKLNANGSTYVDSGTVIAERDLMSAIVDSGMLGGKEDMPSMRIDGSVWIKFGPFTISDSFEEVFGGPEAPVKVQ